MGWCLSQGIPTVNTMEKCDHRFLRIIFVLLISFAHAFAQDPGPNQGYNGQNYGPLVTVDQPTPLGGYEAILKAFIYPEQAMVAKIEGVVRITCIIDNDGHAQDVRDILGPKQLLRAAEDAVELSQWNPGRLNRNPVPLKVEFDLDIRFSNTVELTDTPKDYSNNLILGPIFFGIIYLILSLS